MGWRMHNQRPPLLAFFLAVLLFGCGGSEMSLSEYVERVNAIEQRASQQGELLLAQVDGADDLTPQDVQAGLEAARIIRMEVKEAGDSIEPPEPVADFHHLIFDWHTRFIAVEEALAIRAGAASDTAAGWEDLSESAQMAAYRLAIAEGKTVCVEFQAQLDATAQLGAFADVPWLPSELSEVGQAVLGCAWFPENPQDVYRYPPPT